MRIYIIKSFIRRCEKRLLSTYGEDCTWCGKLHDEGTAMRRVAYRSQPFIVGHLGNILHCCCSSMSLSKWP